MGDESVRAAIEATVPVYADAPPATTVDLERARAAAAALRSGDLAAVDPGDLAVLSPDDAGRLASDLAAAGDTDALALAVSATAPHRYPVLALLRAAAALAPDRPAREPLLRAVAMAPPLRLRSALDEAAADPALAPALDALLADVARMRTELAAGPPYRWWHVAQPAMAEPPDPPEPPGRLEPMGSREESGGSAEGEPKGDAGPRDPVFRDGEADRSAYPRLEVTGTPQPDVVVVDQSFGVVAGIGPRRDRVLVGTGAFTFAAGETVELELVLLYDPTSVEVADGPRRRVTVTDLDPYPTVTFGCTAKYGETLAPERRIGLQVLRDGAVIGVAWRSVVAVETPDQVAAAVVPDRREVELLDLSPLVGDQPPDLVISVCRADAGSDTFVWTAYAADPAVPVPDLPSSSTLEPDIAAFATETRRAIQFSANPAQDYIDLAGRAIRIGRAVPAAVQDALRAVVARPGQSTAPAVLLLTEELTVPWELASPDPPLASTWGGTSPFLGAHAAVSRWPLTEHQPRPRPRSSVTVRSGAVLTADYTGVAGWGRLESAVQEAADVAKLFDPPAPTVEPELWAVVDLFRGRPAADLLHLALHGQYDGQGGQEGIVLLAKSPAGGATAQFLTPTALETGSLGSGDQGPFVFLNACQVGTDERVLGDYGGFASTLLRIGATGVVAPLWNVKDDVAAGIARTFYAAALTAPDPVPVAEAMRAVRATYTEDGVRAGTPGLHATLVAYQVFGHPRLRLTHPDPSPSP